jgi:tetratricopeptide (TPR) repeat protein
MSERRPVWMIVPLVACAVVFCVYANSLWGGFVYDDTYFIEENPLIRDLSNTPEMFTSAFWESSSRASKTFYRPLVVFSYAVNFALGGMNPFGYHLFNVLLHTVNLLLVFALIMAITRDLRLAAATSLLFGLHPIHTEAVAWVSGRTDLLGGFFFLLSLVFYVAACPPDAHREPDTRRKGWLLGGSLVAFVLGVLAKENVVTLIGVIVLYQVVFRRWRLSHARHLALYATASVLYIIWRWSVLGGLGAGATEFVTSPLMAESFGPRMLTGVTIFARYLGLLVAPVRLAVDYSFNQIPIARAPWDPAVLASGLLAMACLALWCVAWKRSPGSFFGLGFFFVTGSLIFANAVFPYGAIMGERFMYLPSLGLLMAAVVLANRAIARLPAGWRDRVAAAGLVVLALSASTRTVVRNLDWRSNFTLFQAAVATNPKSIINHTNLATEYFRMGQYDHARHHYMQAMEIYPAFGTPYRGLGYVAVAEEDYQRGLEYFMKSAALSPDDDETHIALAVAYMRLKRFDEALAELDEAYQMNPRNCKIPHNIGFIHAQTGDHARAVEYYHEALEINPTAAETLLNLAIEYDQRGEADTARTYYERFLVEAPGKLGHLKERVRSRLSAL